MMLRVRLTSVLIAGFLTLVASEARAQWRSVPYDASNFTAAGSMTWTVEAADVKTFRYMVNDRTMTVGLAIEYSSVSGTLANELYVKIPGGYKSGSFLFNQVHVLNNAASPGQEIGVAVTNPNDDRIKLYRHAWQNHQSSTNQTHIYFTITFDLCGDEPNSCP